jgi:hypothetical protein
LPDPLAPEVIVIQEGAVFVAAQGQPEGALTLAEPVPPAPAIDWLTGVTV